MDVQAVEAAFDINAAIARGSVDIAIEIFAFDVTITGLHADGAFASDYGDAAVASFNIDISVESIGFDRAIAGGDFKVGVFRHVHFDAQVGMMDAPIENATAGSFRDDFDLVAILRGGDAEVAVELVAGIGDADFDLFDITGRDANGAVVGQDADFGVAVDGEGLGDFFGAGEWRGGEEQGCGQGQRGKGMRD